MGTEIGDLGWEAAGASDSSVMILTCPECATSYFVDDSRIAASGRTVKCSNCGARWMALPDGVAESPPPPKAKPAPPPPAPVITPVDEVVFEAPAPISAPVTRKPATAGREANGKVTILVGSAVVIAALIAAAIVFRAQVVQMLPASQAAYAGLGLPVSSLAIEKIHADAGFQGGHAALQITGQLRNLRDEEVAAPPLRVSLLDRLGKPVSVKIARPIDAAIPAHAIRHFAISIVDPPASAHDLKVAFEPSGKAKAATAAVPAQPAPATPGPASSLPAHQASK